MGLEKMKIAKRLGALAVAGLAFGGAAHGADSATETHALTATAPNTSLITTIAQTANNNLTLAAGTFTVGPAAFDPTTATFTGANISASVTMNVMSNYAHTVSLQTTNGGMTPAAVVPVVSGTFISKLNYTAILLSAPPAFILSLNTSAAAALASQSINVAGAMISVYTLTVTVDNSNTTTPILAGTYSDTLVLKVGQPL